MSGNFSVAAVSGALLVLAVAAVASTARYQEPDGALDFWRPGTEGEAHLERLWQQRLALLPPPERFEGLSHALMRLNLAVMGPAADARDVRDLSARLGREVDAFLSSQGSDAYLAVGTYLAREFATRLDKVVGQMAGSGQDPDDWLRANAGQEDVRALVALAGDYMTRARASGLVSRGGGLDRDQVLLARLMWVENWMNAASGRLGTDVTEFERGVVLKWKVEAAAHLGIERKLALLAEVHELDPEYPAFFVKGILEVGAGMQPEALVSFRRSLESERLRQRTTAWVVFLRDAM
jgi:hypothetical protein